jgi:DNA primase
LIPEAQTVYLCEGETDVVTLIDRGIEDDGESVGLNPEVRFTSAVGRTVAVGVQGATLNIERWAFLFRDKHVVIAMDDDEAGWKADANIGRVLSTVATSIEHFWSIAEVAQSWT